MHCLGFVFNAWKNNEEQNCIVVGIREIVLGFSLFLSFLLPLSAELRGKNDDDEI